MSSKGKAGDIAGGPNKSKGYWVITLDGCPLLAHRLAWFYAHGVMPPAHVDHINGIKADNRIANLRLATRSENMRNSRVRQSTSGLKGAHRIKERRGWASKIQKEGKRFYLGYFATAEEAHAAYAKAATELHEQFARTV